MTDTEWAERTAADLDWDAAYYEIYLRLFGRNPVWEAAARDDRQTAERLRRLSGRGQNPPNVARRRPRR